MIGYIAVALGATSFGFLLACMFNAAKQAELKSPRAKGESTTTADK
ncbi:MAG TPA: hypothetical protein VGE05_05295 [Novosphingobium sp.]